MKKKLIIIISVLLTVLSMATYSIFSSLAIKEYVSKDMKVDFPDKFIAYQIVRCDFGINNIEYAFIGEYKDRIDNLKIFFYKMKRSSIFNTNDWSDDYIGGTTIKNTTFPELVKMVKEDCSQFQEDYDNPLVDEGGIDWGYREADPPEPPKTEDELENEKHIEMVNAINNVLGFVDNMLTNLQRDKFIEFYGDIHSMTNEEIYQIYLQLMESGEMMVDESLHEFFYNEYGMKYVEYE